MVTNSELPGIIPLEKVLESQNQGPDSGAERPLSMESDTTDTTATYTFRASSLPPLPAPATSTLPYGGELRNPYVWTPPYDRSLQTHSKRMPVEFELSGALINYQKFRNISSVIKLFQSFHNPDKLYEGFELDMEVYHHCLYLRNVLDSETLADLSEKCEGKRPSQHTSSQGSPRRSGRRPAGF